MAQIKKEFEAVEEFDDIASKLVNKYPEVFGGVDCEKIKCVAITNKNRREGKKLWEVRGVPAPISMDCPFNYYIILFMEDWIEMNDNRRAVLVAATLMAIPHEEDKEGKVNNFDMKDYYTMVRTFGVDYLESEGIPDILNEDVKWRF